jgi:hypothetical protein
MECSEHSATLKTLATQSNPTVATQSKSAQTTVAHAHSQAPDAEVDGLDLNRQVLTRGAGVAGLAATLEADLRPRSELEAMLADQLATAHNAALRIMEAASTRGNPETVMALTVTACRVMKTFQEGLLVLHRLRHGDQRVVVQHVQLSDNAQAIVAGELNKHAE